MTYTYILQNKPEKLLKLCARPHIFSRQLIWAIWSRRKIFLNGIVGQMNWSAWDNT